MRSCPERAYILAFFAPPPPLSDENPVMLHFFAYAEIIFAHILVFPACAIEVQHINKNSPTSFSHDKDRCLALTYLKSS